MDLAHGWRTRFAPAPTGFLHLGHVVNAIHAWGLARARDGRVLLRIEDHDRSRYRAEYEAALLEDLAWLGFEPDGPVERQRDNTRRYESALEVLQQAGLVYPCACSRRDYAADTDAPNMEARYPGTCRPRLLDPASTPARRIIMAAGSESFTDLRRGLQSQDPSRQCGDLLARDRLGQWTYQFAVTVDDIAQRIDLVIRGEDLLESTGRQMALARLLGRPSPPQFLHHDLSRHPDGSKLSKSAGDTGVREMRAAGATPEEVIGRAAFLAGLTPSAQPISAHLVARLFAD